MATIVCPEHSGLATKAENLKQQVEKQWTMIEKLQTRLPLWATGTISLLTFCLGWSLSWIIYLEKAVKAVAHN
jgi:hypothetical protein